MSKNKTLRVDFVKSSIRKKTQNKIEKFNLDEIHGEFKIKVLTVEFIENPWNTDRPVKVYDNWLGWQTVPNTRYKLEVSRYGIGYKATFEFTDSIHNFENSKPVNLIGAFRCLLDDASSFTYVQSFDEDEGIQNVMDEFGYEDFRKAKKVYRGIYANYMHVKNLGIDDDNLYKLLDQEHSILGEYA
jgi:hypothetical protein